MAAGGAGGGAYEVAFAAAALVAAGAAGGGCGRGGSGFRSGSRSLSGRLGGPLCLVAMRCWVDRVCTTGPERRCCAAPGSWFVPLFVCSFQVGTMRWKRLWFY